MSAKPSFYRDGDVAISVVAPAYNEAACAAAFVLESVAKLCALGGLFELICVDDGSEDATPKVLSGLEKEQPTLRVIRLDRHVGKSGALHAGFTAARGGVIGTIDVDLQNDPADFSPMYKALSRSTGPTCVAGWRQQRADSYGRRWSSRVANRVSRVLTGDPTHDAGCGMKLAHASLFKALPRFEGMHRFIAPLVLAAGGTVIEVPIGDRPRYAGRSKYGSGFGRAFGAFRDALKVRRLIRSLPPTPVRHTEFES
jgi:dolichol-phosphate mannosyltransferase